MGKYKVGLFRPVSQSDAVEKCLQSNQVNIFKIQEKLNFSKVRVIDKEPGVLVFEDDDISRKFRETYNHRAVLKAITKEEHKTITITSVARKSH